MERSTQRSGLINLVALLLVGVAGFAVARVASSLAGQLSAVFTGLGALVAAVSWFQMRLEERERLEKLEMDELARTKGGSALFEAKDVEVFPAQRSREQFERFFVPAFTCLLFLAEAGGAYLLWRWLSRSTTVVGVKNPALALALFGLFALILFLLGKFSATIARLENNRLLRPGANWLLLSAYLSFIVGLGIVGIEAGFPRTDLYVARGLCVLLGIIGIETFINLVLEIYRPRVKGRVERPLYDNRMVGVFAQPESLFTTAAQALDYQFGFKVSETWFFRLLQQNLPTLVAAQVAVLALSTCFVIIEPGQQGVLERFGRLVPGRSVLHPGAHLKLPWPIDKVYRYNTRRIQTFDVGFQQTPESEQEHTIVWTVPHTKEENFLVASHEAATVETGAAENTVKVPPVSLLTVSIPVDYQISNVLDWAYNNAGSSNLLRDVANREVVRYLVSVDYNAIMSNHRLPATDVLRQRIQAAADAHHLGVRIFYVGLQDIHPPVKVAPDYEKVVAAQQTKEAAILNARADSIHTNALAEAQSYSTTNEAMAVRQRLEVSSLAQAALFTNQIPAFEAAPSVYRQRVYFQAFGQAVANTPKYVLLTTNTRDVLVFDLQHRIREDLLNLNVKAPRTQ